MSDSYNEIIVKGPRKALLRAHAGTLDQEDLGTLYTSHGNDIMSMEDNSKLHTAELVTKSSELTVLSYTAPQLSVRGTTWTQKAPSWPLQRINRRRWSTEMSPPADYSFSALGTGVNAYIVDTGIRFSHKEFGSFPDGSGTSRALPAMSGVSLTTLCTASNRCMQACVRPGPGGGTLFGGVIQCTGVAGVECTRP